ncbi:MAG: IPT/TIG domain-containing protein, partial [Acidobacteria bacterium]|nr:IPT/TIG domain-containing protein [Acidobacteriota bacterium]
PAEYTAQDGSTAIRPQVWVNHRGWGVVDVTVVNADGGQAVLRDGFRLDPPDGAPETQLVPPNTWPTVFESFDVRGTLGVLGTRGGGNDWPYPGRAFVYRRSEGRWRFETALAAPEGLRLFGSGVATDGTAITVGDSTSASAFALHVYEQTAGVWHRVARITLPGTYAYHPLAMDAGVLVAGSSVLAQAFVYTRGADGWALAQTLQPADAGSVNFGRTVAIDGSWLAVGADAAVTTFENVGGEWLQRTVLGSPLRSGMVFGGAVALGGSTMAVGVPDDSPSGAAGRGSVFVFERSGSNWTQAAQLIAPDGVAGDQFGTKVRIRGSWLAVFAPGVKAAGDQVGAVYLYERRNNTWQLNGRLVAWDYYYRFTVGVAMGDQELFVGVGVGGGVAIYPIPPVVVSGVQPWIGPTAGGAVVTIDGQHFEAGSTVTIGGSPATDVAVIGPLELTARVPAHAVGTVDVVVRHPNGLSGTLAGGYTYRDVDLIISTLASPARLGPGESDLVTVTTRNEGTGGVPFSTSAIYLSSDTVVDASDVLLNTHTVPPLKANRTSRAVVEIQVPAGTPAGSYYLIAVADANSDVGESIETNNVRTKELRVGCDLVVSVIDAPQHSKPGGAVKIDATTRNHGPGLAPATTTRLYFSADEVIGLGDRVIGVLAVGPLAVGAGSTGSLKWTIPAGTALGRYYILAKADAGGTAPETNEGNNVRATPIVVR